MEAETEACDEAPSSESSRMEEIKKMNKEIIQITWSLEDKMFDKARLLAKEERVNESADSWKRWEQRQKLEKLSYLKRDLDKLCFRNKTYRTTQFITEEGVDVQNLHFLMHHGSNNSLHKERKYLKQINEEHREEDTDSNALIQEIMGRINKLWKQRFPLHGEEWGLLEKRTQEEDRLLRLVKEGAFAKAPVNGETWNSLRTNQDMIQQIKAIEKKLDEEREENKVWVGAEMSVLKRDFKGTERDIRFLQKKLTDLRMRKHSYVTHLA